MVSVVETGGVRVHDRDPAPLLQAAFARVERERMAGMPMLNAALQVEAIGFTRWQGQWLGALLTPWFLNLVLVPGDRASWRAVGEGQRVFHRFAAGDFAFLGGDEPEVGAFQCCSLYSPVDLFETQDAARETARAALAMLHVERSAAPAAVPAGGCGGTRAAAAPAEVPVMPPRSLSKRGFLFGRPGTRDRT